MPRLGPGFPPECGDGQPGTARGVQRQSAQDHRLLRRPVAEPGAVRQIQGTARGPGIRGAVRPAPEDHRQRGARFPSRRRGTGGGQEAALQGDSGGTVGAVGQVRGKPARCDQRFRPVRRERGRAGRHSRRCLAGDAEGGAEGRQAGLEVHPAHAVLHAGDAVRRQPRPARADLPRLRDPRLRVRQARLGQHRADRGDPQVAPGSRAAAGIRQLRRGFAGDQDGADAAAGAGFPRRPGRAGEALCREGLRRTEGVRPRRAGHGGPAGVGQGLCGGKAAPRPLQLLRPGSEAVFPRNRRAGRPVQADRNALRPAHPRGLPRRCGIPT